MLGKRQYPRRLGTEDIGDAQQAWASVAAAWHYLKHFGLKLHGQHTALLIKEARGVLELRNHRCHSPVGYLEMPRGPVSQSVC